MILLDGKKVSQEIQQELANEVLELTQRFHLPPPHLAAVLVGNDPASQTYVQHKIKACQKVGIQSSLYQKPAECTEVEILSLIDTLNSDTSVDGILVQLPLPKGISENRIIEQISYEKDVDGFHPINIGRMTKGLPAILPATPAGIIELLRRYKIETTGKECVVVGRSNIVGSPMSILLARNTYPGNATVTLCHSKTVDLEYHLKRADIVIAAAGKCEFIRGNHLKQGSVVIDVGIHRITNPNGTNRLIGDVCYEEVSQIAAAITPVPGGVGPMTIASLLQNTLQAYRQKHAIPQ